MDYCENEKALIFLSQFDFMSNSKFEKVLEVFSSPKDIFTASPKELFELKEVFKDKYEILVNEIVNFNEREFFKSLEQRNIKCLTIMSDNYPARLLNLKNPPYVLYYVGNIDLINSKAIAIVGTRSPSNYGKQVTEKYAKELAEKGLTIVSGLASGVDKIAHEGALDVGGNTIAVLGGGLDHIYPAMNVNLAREIGKKGLIITEYYLSIKPTKYTFPTRNRIIAGLSNAVLITEAKGGSGSLYTKEYADELGIDSYCIPGNITSEKSEATNRLIKIGSAICTTSPIDILKNFGIAYESEEKRKRVSKAKLANLTIEQAVICEFLKDGEQDFTFLQEKTKYSAQILNYNLTTLEINGIIKKLAGNCYMLV